MHPHRQSSPPAAIRMARRFDLPELVAMIHALALHQGDVATATEEALGRDLFGATRLLDVFVATQEGRIVGYLASARSYQAQFARRCVDIHHLYVEPDRRGVGIGRALVEACLDYASALGCREANIGASAGHDVVVGFYGAVGFSEARGGSRLARAIG